MSFYIHYKFVKKKVLISIKHDLIIGKNMPEIYRQKILRKNLDYMKTVFIFPHFR